MQEHVKATMGLNISPFTKAMHKAKQNSKGLGRALKSALGFFGVSFALQRLGSAVGDFADKLVDTSRKLSVSTDFLQAWNFAALQIGISADTSNMALQRFGRRLGEAAQGQGVLAAVLSEGNIALRDNQGTMRATTDILGDYADMVQRAESSNEQLRLSNLAFDSEGVGLVTMLRDGSDGLRAMIENARELNAVVSNDTLIAINRFTTKLKTLGTRGLGFVAQYVGDVTRALKTMAALAKEIFAGNIFDGEGVALSEFFTEFDKNYDSALAKVDELAAKAKKITEETGKAIQLEKQKVQLLQSQIDAQNALSKAKQERTKTTLDKVAETDVRTSLTEFFRKQRQRGAVEKNLRERADAANREGRFADAESLNKQAAHLRILINLGQGINPRQLAEDREKAQRIQQLELFAKELGQFGDQGAAQQAQSLADKLRKEMGRLTSAEQNPNAALETAVAKSTEQLVTVNTQITEIKTSIAALNTP